MPGMINYIILLDCSKYRKLKPPIPEKKFKMNTQISLDIFDSNTNSQTAEKDHIIGWSFVAKDDKIFNPIDL